MAPTIKDVARRAGVGIATVSRVLNDSPNVLPSTRARVLNIIDELGYRPNQAARQLVTARSHAIAVVLPFITRPFFIEILRGIESVIAQSGYQLIIFNVETVDRRTHYFNTMPFLGRTDGLIVISLPLSPGEVERLQAVHVPAVFIDISADGCSSVLVDNVAGAQAAVEHLIERGHTRIAYTCGPLYPPLGFTVNRDRQQGYELALAAHRLPVRPEYIRAGGDGRQAGYQLALELLALPVPPTAIFTASDEQAFGAMDAIQERGLQVGTDVAVVGYDDLELAHYVGLTTMRQPMEQMGRVGAQILLDSLDANRTAPVVQTISTTLIQRRSS
ncbi:MAG TPA: LacI family DNA-binding transcriptional regulator [Herpetosiphonaceae bacterium]|nr:LacI family DNA-binding transcriptional regulator [Herpetosiphonaceae bacterium]